MHGPGIQTVLNYGCAQVHSAAVHAACEAGDADRALDLVAALQASPQAREDATAVTASFGLHSKAVKVWTV